MIGAKTMHRKDDRAAKAQEMLKHVQESMAQLKNLRKQSFRNIPVEQSANDNKINSVDKGILKLNASAVKLDSFEKAMSNEDQFFESSVFRSSNSNDLNGNPSANYVSFKTTLEDFLYDEKVDDPFDPRDIQLEAMALELQELTTVQDQALCNLTSEIGELTKENQILVQQNEDLLSKNQRLQQLVQSLNIESEQLKDQILNIHRSNTFFYQTAEAGTTDGLIPIISVNSTDGPQCFNFQNQHDSDSHYTDFQCKKDIGSNWSQIDFLEDNHQELETFENDGWSKSQTYNADTASGVSAPVIPEIISFGDSAGDRNILEKTDKKKKSKTKGILKLFRRGRKGKYSFNTT